MLTVVLLTSTLFALAGARVYGRCELARELLRLGVSRDQVPTWVCIAYHESRFNTAAWNTYSGDHGLLQISELYWCGHGKACGLSCSSLRDTDISDDIQCALRIYREHTRLQGDGFMAWVVYPQHCRGVKNYVKDCNRLGKTMSEKLNNVGQPVLKPHVLNFTVPQFADTSNNNQPLPGYLAINSLIKEINFEKFEQDYYNTNKRKFDWLNYKIDNIDELKLPVANRRGRVELAIPPTATTYTTTTTARTTTTLDPALIGIKPPSPRKIESNQFRKRKMKLEHEPNKTNNDSLVMTSIVLPTSSSTTTNKTITPYTLSHTFIEDILSPTTTVIPTTGTTLRTTGESNSENTYLKRTQKPTTKEPVTSGAVVARKTNEAFRAFLVLSYPHFLYADFSYRNGIVGMHPFEEQHRIFVDLEPNTGTVIRGMKRAQFNVFMRPVTGVPSTRQLRTTLMPIFWVEEGMQLPEEYVDMLTTRLLQRLRLVDILLPVIIAACALIVVLGVAILIRVRYVRKNSIGVKPHDIPTLSNTIDK